MEGSVIPRIRSVAIADMIFLGNIGVYGSLISSVQSAAFGGIWQPREGDLEWSKMWREPLTPYVFEATLRKFEFEPNESLG